VYLYVMEVPHRYVGPNRSCEIGWFYMCMSSKAFMVSLILCSRRPVAVSLFDLHNLVLLCVAELLSLWYCFTCVPTQQLRFRQDARPIAVLAGGPCWRRLLRTMVRILVDNGGRAARLVALLSLGGLILHNAVVFGVDVVEEMEVVPSDALLALSGPVMWFLSMLMMFCSVLAVAYDETMWWLANIIALYGRTSSVGVSVV